MKSYEEMAEAVFREGDARIAAKQKKKKKIAAGTAAGLALTVGLAVFGILRHTPETVQPSALSAPDATTVTTATRETTTQANSAMTTTDPAQQQGRTADATSTTESLLPEATATRPAVETPAQTETPSANGQNGGRNEATTTLTTTPSEENPSGAASYNSADWTEANVNQNGWARFPRWPGYEAKFWVYYDGRTYRCDPFAGRPLAYGDLLCKLSDCAHDFADEEGAEVYVMMEDGAPVPVTTAVVIVFPDGDSYAMIREPSQD